MEKNKSNGRRMSAGGKNNYIIQGSILAIAGIVVRIIGLLYRIPVTNIIGDIGNAYYNNAYEIYNVLLLISSVGMPVAISTMVSGYMVLGQAKNAVRVLKSAAIFSTVIGMACGLLIFVFAKPLANMGAYPESIYALRVLGPTIFILALVSVLRGYFQGVGTVIPTAFSQILEQIVNAVVSIAASSILLKYGLKIAANLTDKSFDYASAYGASGATLGTAAGAFTAFVFLVFVFFVYRKVIYRQTRRDHTRNLESYNNIYRSLLVTIIPITISVIVYNCTNLIDTNIYGNILKSLGVEKETYTALWGIYTGKFRTLMNVPLSIASCLTPSLVPNLTAAMVTGDKKQVRESISNSIRYTMFITLPMSVGMMVLASPILQLLYRDTSTSASKILLTGSLMIPFLAYSTLGNGILQGINQLKAPIINGVIALAAHVLVLIPLLYLFPDYGIYAVIASNIFFSILMCVLNSISVKKHLKYRQEFRVSILIPGICSIIMGVFAFAAYKCFYFLFSMLLGSYSSNFFSVIISILIAVAVYCIAILKLKGLSESEILGFPKGEWIVKTLKSLRLL